MGTGYEPTMDGGRAGAADQEREMAWSLAEDILMWKNRQKMKNDKRWDFMLFIYGLSAFSTNLLTKYATLTQKSANTSVLRAITWLMSWSTLSISKLT